MRRTAIPVIALTVFLPAQSWATDITVKAGDTLSQISKRYHVPIERIMRLNNISDSNQIKIGSKLKLIDNKNGQTTYKNSIHKVNPGETIQKISRLYQINKDELISFNNLIHPDILYPGQIIKIPQGIQSSGIQKNSKASTHTIQKGETLTEISKLHKVPINTIIKINKIKDPNNIEVGTKISLNLPPKSLKKSSIYNQKQHQSRKSEWRTYGPLKIDWSQWNLMAGSFVAPSLNNKGKPLYIAVNCSVRKINSTGENGTWRSWEKPLKSFEKDLLIDLCKTKVS